MPRADRLAARQIRFDDAAENFARARVQIRERAEFGGWAVGRRSHGDGQNGGKGGDAQDDRPRRDRRGPRFAMRKVAGIARGRLK